MGRSGDTHGAVKLLKGYKRRIVQQVRRVKVHGEYPAAVLRTRARPADSAFRRKAHSGTANYVLLHCTFGLAYQRKNKFPQASP